MLRRVDLTAVAGVASLRQRLPRAALDVRAATAAIAPVVDDIAARGYPAAREATLRFDGVDVADPRVPAAALTPPWRRSTPWCAPRWRSRSAGPAWSTRRSGAATTSRWCPGGSVTERWVPVARVGLYVPGGIAVYPSSVVMNVVPAQVAGVEAIAVFSPPQKEFGGAPHPTTLAACALLGVDGGVRRRRCAGRSPWPPTATRSSASRRSTSSPGRATSTWPPPSGYVRGLVGIDAEAGPTEIAILADDTADPVHVAADLISQAEHDPLAASVLVTDSDALADAVDDEVERQVALTKHAERVRAALSGAQSAIVLVRDLEHGLAVVDAYAAEHLEVITADARALAERVRNAGCVFVGPYSPVSLGDYCAGSNHVLPTGCTARHASGLSVQTLPQGGAPRRVRPRRAGRRRPARAGARRPPRTCPRTAPPCGPVRRRRRRRDDHGRAPTAPVSLERAAAAPELRRRRALRRPAARRAGAAEHQREPLPARAPRPSRPSTAAVARGRRRAQPLPRPRGAGALRADLAAYLAGDGAPGLGAEEVWAANGSNEVLRAAAAGLRRARPHAR